MAKEYIKEDGTLGNDVAAEENGQIEEKKQKEVDESVRIIREVSESTEVESTNFTPDVREKGDGAFHAVLCIGLIVVGFGLLLDFLTRKIKKD